MMRMAAAVFVLLAAEATAARQGQSFLGGGAERMQPEVVAHSLAHMESEWNAQAMAFAECNATSTTEDEMSACTRAPKAFLASCSTVVSALVQSSSGDRTSVSEYMGTVCGEHELEGWRQERCQDLAAATVGAMSADSAENRDGLNAQGVCEGLWKEVVVAEKAVVEKKQAEEETAHAEDEKQKAAAEHQVVEHKKEATNASMSGQVADMTVTAKAFMEVSLGPFSSAPEACDYCADSFTKTGQPPAGPVAPACVCMAYPEDGGFTMFCATPASAAGFVKDKGGCRCNPRDMEHMAATTCEPL